MTSTLKRLHDENPDLFVKGYFNDLPEGWGWIVESFIESTKRWRWMEDGKEVSNYSFLHIVQCKEKFGTLRLYIDVSDDTNKDMHSISGELHGAATFAEHLSSKTCAVCGTMDQASMRNNNGYYLTLCDQCFTTKAYK